MPKPIPWKRIKVKKPLPAMSFRGSESESRNLPKWQVLSCVGSFPNVVDSSTPLSLKV